MSKLDKLSKNKELKEKIKKYLKTKYSKEHNINTDKQLYEYTMDIKNKFLKKSKPLSKVIYDKNIILKNQALGLHSYIPRSQGSKIKVKNEIKIATKFKRMPLEFLEHIVVHELAHLKEKNHDKSFKKLCSSMQNNFEEVEKDLNIYLTYVELFNEDLY